MRDDPDRLPVEFELNGSKRKLEVAPDERLLDTLRYTLGLTGTKEGCAEGECGACTVLLDDVPVNSCLVPTYQVRSRRVDTIESISEDRLEAYLRGGATQCGACTPGVVMTAEWIRRHPELLESHRPQELLAGNLCRCTGYDSILVSLAEAMRGDDSGGRE